MLLLFFFILTIILLSKLNSILGLDIGIKLEKHSAAYSGTDDQSNVSEVDAEEVAEKKDVLEVFRRLYPSFNENDFIAKAKKAFELIFQAYADANFTVLEDLLAPRIFDAFSLAIKDRLNKKQKLEGILIRIISADIVDTKVEDDNLFVVMKFLTEQSNALKSESGEILDGNLDFIETKSDVWVFHKKSKSGSNKWYLYDIKLGEAS